MGSCVLGQKLPPDHLLLSADANQIQFTHHLVTNLGTFPQYRAVTSNSGAMHHSIPAHFITDMCNMPHKLVDWMKKLSSSEPVKAGAFTAKAFLKKSYKFQNLIGLMQGGGGGGVTRIFLSTLGKKLRCRPEGKLSDIFLRKRSLHVFCFGGGLLHLNSFRCFVFDYIFSTLSTLLTGKMGYPEIKGRDYKSNICDIPQTQTGDKAARSHWVRLC